MNRILYRLWRNRRTVACLALLVTGFMLVFNRGSKQALDKRIRLAETVEGAGGELRWEGAEGGSLLKFAELPRINVSSLDGIPLGLEDKQGRTRAGALAATLVFAATDVRQVEWADRSEALAGWDKVVYLPPTDAGAVADMDAERDRSGQLSTIRIARTPASGGNEAMAYLSYMIDAYERLPELVVFVHHHRLAWHNNDLLNFDAEQMLGRLLATVRESAAGADTGGNVVARAGGYVNLRCHWDPGCPSSLFNRGAGGAALAVDRKAPGELEAVMDAWAALFPDQGAPPPPRPPLLAQPCCAQFSVTAERIRATSLSTWISLRQWLMEVTGAVGGGGVRLSSALAGRVFEHTWHALLLPGNPAVACADMRECYCSLYRMCFPDGDHFRAWFAARARLRRYGDYLRGHRGLDDVFLDSAFEEALRSGEIEPGSDAARARWVEAEIASMAAFLDEARREALRNGLGLD